jgi:hypothetical protein
MDRHEAKVTTVTPTEYITMSPNTCVIHMKACNICYDHVVNMLHTPLDTRETLFLAWAFKKQAAV